MSDDKKIAVSYVRPIAPDATGQAAYDRFAADPDLLLLPVIDHGVPVGLISRTKFLMKFADRFGHALYAKRPVSFVMQANPMFVRADSSISDLAAEILEFGSGALLDGFLLVDAQARYVGVGTALDLLRATARDNRAKVNELTRKTAELAQAEAKAQAAAIAKGQFLATMSHEIRTPLNGILGLANVLAKQNLSPEGADMLRSIENSGDLLLRLLSDVLDYSKIEAGKLDIAEGETDLQRLAAETHAMFAPQAAQKGLDFLLDYEPNLPPLIRADGMRLRQIVLNLVGNAVKFTASGRVKTHFSRCALNGGPALCVTISDTGIGVSPELQPHLFSPFAQGDSSTTRNFGGSGLGLAICKRLVNLMGGDIGYAPELGHGSRFYFRIPLQAIEMSPALPATIINADPRDLTDLKLRTLVAEDNVVNQMVIAKMLEAIGLRCDIVGDGYAALRRLDEAAFDLVLLDMNMPGLDGLDTIKTIRARTDAQAQMPALVVTACAMPGDRERLIAAGFDAYVEKPIRPALLRQAIVDAIEARRKVAIAKTAA